MAAGNRLDAGEELHSRPAIGSGRVLRRLLSRLYRWRRHDPRVYRSLSRREERALCLRTPLRVHRLGEPGFIEWLQTSVSRLTGISGSMEVRHHEHAHPVWKLRYAKAQSIRLLVWMYYAATVPCLY